MSGRLTDKTALVTGAASGLGRGAAEHMLREGARVVLTDLDARLGPAVAAQLGEGASFLPLDVADAGQWQDVVAQLQVRFDALDILVNNAGLVIPGSVEDARLEDFQMLQHVMVDGVFLGCQACMPLLKRSRAASIINIASVASHYAYPGLVGYSAAKGAVRAMSKSIAGHCQKQGYAIRCNSVHPSGIATPLADKALGRDEASADGVASGVLPVGARGAVSDVADMVVFLASDESRFCTGGEFMVDNGLGMHGAGGLMSRKL